MKNSDNLSYLNFLSKAKAFNNADISDLESLLNSFSLPNFSSLYPDAVFLTDYVNCKYLYVSINGKGFIGYTRQQLLNAGPAFICDIYHPYDFKIFNEKVFPDNVMYLKKHLDKDYDKLVFTVNYRLKNAQGRYYTLSQRSSYVSIAADGTPLAEISAISDISEYKTDLKIVHLIEKHNSQDTTTLIARKFYQPSTEQVVLSKREIDILRWVCEGFGSKQIADKLNISIHTINNHRKNMLKKTNCHNLTELLHNAICDGVI